MTADNQQIPSEAQVDLYAVATKMREAQLSDAFIADAVDAAREYQGIHDLMMMWAETRSEERDEIVADIQDMLDEVADQRGVVEERYVRFDDLDRIAADIRGFKDGLLRILNDRDWTMSELAERTGMPLPSLSRFFNSASMPRRRTLLRIAEALELSAVEVATDWDY